MADFDTIMCNFYMAYGEKREEDLAETLVSLQEAVEAEVLCGHADAAVHLEITKDCENKARQFAKEMVPRLKQVCAEGNEEGALGTMSLAAQLGAGEEAAAMYGQHMRKTFRQRAAQHAKKLQSIQQLQRIGGVVEADDVSPHTNGIGELVNFATWQVHHFFDALSLAMVPVSANAAGPEGAAGAAGAAGDGLDGLEAVKLAEVQGLDFEVTTHVLRTLQMFQRDRKLELWEKRAIEQEDQGGSGRAGRQDAAGDKGMVLSEADIKQLSLVLDELQFLLQLTKKYNQSMEQCGGVSGETVRTVLGQELGTLMMSYMLLDKLWMLQNAHGCVRNAEVFDFEGTPISSVVEDSTFILKKAFQVTSIIITVIFVIVVVVLCCLH